MGREKNVNKAGEKDTVGRVWVPAPSQDNATTGSIQGLWVFPGQEVEWVWTHTPNGSFVSGYVLGSPIAEFKPKTKEAGS